MKILFVTDFHGKKEKFKLMVEQAIKFDVDFIIDGGDFNTARGGVVFEQKQFIEEFIIKKILPNLPENICYILTPGNHDLSCYDNLIPELLQKFHNVFYLNNTIQEIGGFYFVNFSFIPDGMMWLKDRARTEGFPPLHKGGISTPEYKFKQVNWLQESIKLPSLREEIEKLPISPDYSKTIFISHCPPTGLGLDAAHGKEFLGSKEIASYILDKQPLLSLHGHIHESPKLMGKWYGFINKTKCIQPGQNPWNFTGVVIDTENLQTIKHNLKLETTRV